VGANIGGVGSSEISATFMIGLGMRSSAIPGCLDDATNLAGRSDLP
jgi:hypothetical protein